MIDSHCHIAGPEFAVDLDGVVARAREAGLAAALCIVAAQDPEEVAAVARVRALWPQVRIATGIHPHQAADFTARVSEGVDLVRRRVTDLGAIAIGEIGLDYHYDFSPRDLQQEVFRAQIELACELRLPIVVHTREATSDTFQILRDAGRGEVRGVFHCFTGDETMAREAVEMGFYVSFSGIVTFPRSAEIRAAATIVPAERLLAETDSPYLAPVPYRGTRNEPAHVVRVVAALADLRGEDRDGLVSRLDANFGSLFGQ